MSGISAYLNDIYVCESMAYECENASVAMEAFDAKGAIEKFKALITKALRAIQEAISNIIERVAFMIMVFKNRKGNTGVKAYKPVADGLNKMVDTTDNYLSYLTEHMNSMDRLITREQWNIFNDPNNTIEGTYLNTKRKAKESYDAFINNDMLHEKSIDEYKGSQVGLVNISAIETKLGRMHKAAQKQLSMIKKTNNQIIRRMNLNTAFALTQDDKAIKQQALTMVKDATALTNFLYSIAIKMVYRCQVVVNAIMKNPPIEGEIFDAESFKDHAALPAST